MDGVLLFLGKSIAVSGLLTGWYWLGLRNRRLHQYNRFFLLFTLYASIQLPLLHFHWFALPPSTSVAATTGFSLIRVMNDAEGDVLSTTLQQSEAAINWLELIALIAIGISCVLLVLLFVKAATVIKISRRNPHTIVNGTELVVTEHPAAPFSFLHMLFWRQGMSWENENGLLVLRHEATHIEQRHTYDKLVCQVFTSVFWFNPFYWLIQKELGMIHEFIADERAVAGSDTKAFASMLLYAHDGGKHLDIVNSFYSSPIKRRLIMLQKSKAIRHSALRRAIVLPIIASAVLLFSMGTRKIGPHVPEIGPVERAEKKIILVVDAGHGGQDYGCSKGALSEKELNLKVARRIADLAPQFNVEVHLTRSGDEGLSLKERVAVSDKWHADDFVSLHIADEPLGEKEMNDQGFGIVVSSTANISASKKVAMNVLARTLPVRNQITPDSKGQVSTRESIYVCRHNSAPGILVELGDIKNKAQMEMLTDDSKLDRLCSAILQGVVATHKS